MSSKMGLNRNEPVYVGGNQSHQITSISNIDAKIDGLVRSRAERNANLLGDYHTIANEK